MMDPTLTRQEIEQREQETLAPYAAKAAESLGRHFPSAEHPLRTAFQRDRDRIVHSAAFRRLEYKTQVFIPHERDHFRTRLTHTIEVAQVARTLARSLRLNEDLAEAIALVHDLGHTPFGHSGEDVLADLLIAFGGFNHNRQTLRIVDRLEQRYLEHPGLNLTFEVREGIVKHETSWDHKVAEFDDHTHPTLEAALVDIADELAYNAHDVDDGLSAGLITFEQLQRLSLWEALRLDTRSTFAVLQGDQKRYALVRRLIDLTATDVIQFTASQLERHRITSLPDVRAAGEKLTGYSEDVRPVVADLKKFLYAELYKHPKLGEMAKRARVILEGIFDRLMAAPERMPARFREMLEMEETEIVVTDYMAGMTDRYAEKVYGELTGKKPPSIPMG